MIIYYTFQNFNIAVAKPKNQSKIDNHLATVDHVGQKNYN